MKKTLQIIFFPLALFRLILLVISTLFFLFTVIIEDKIAKSKGSFKFWSSKYWGKTSLFILGIHVNNNHLPSIDKYILMPNHRSYIDTFLIAAFSPSAFVAKAELLSWPIIGRALKSDRAITVNRKELKSLLDTMDKIKQSIENNISVTVFPEGTTSKGPGILSLKKGTFKIAAELQIPIIPCAIAYKDTDLAWYGDDSFVGHFFKELWKPFSVVNIRFADPIQSNDYIYLIDKTKNSIGTMLASIQNNT